MIEYKAVERFEVMILVVFYESGVRESRGNV